MFNLFIFWKENRDLESVRFFFFFTHGSEDTLLTRQAGRQGPG